MDELLARADRAVADSIRIQERAMEQLGRAREVTAETARIIRQVHADRAGENPRIRKETAGMMAYFQGSPKGNKI